MEPLQEYDGTIREKELAWPFIVDRGWAREGKGFCDVNTDDDLLLLCLAPSYTDACPPTQTAGTADFVPHTFLSNFV